MTGDDVQEDFCNQSLVGLMTLPPGSDMTLDDLQRSLCNFDLDKLSSELQKHLDLQKVIEEV